MAAHGNRGTWACQPLAPFPQNKKNTPLPACLLACLSARLPLQVAAGSLVLKSVPPKTLVAGSPAKEIGTITGGWGGCTACTAGLAGRGWLVGELEKGPACRRAWLGDQAAYLRQQPAWQAGRLAGHGALCVTQPSPGAAPTYPSPSCWCRQPCSQHGAVEHQQQTAGVELGKRPLCHHWQ